MELKKNPGSDLRNWNQPIANLALATSVAMVLVAFEWKTKEDKPLLDFNNGITDWEMEVIPITIHNPPPVTPPPVAPPEIKIMDNDVIIEDSPLFDLNFPENESIPEVKLEGPPDIDVAPEIMDFTEVQAQFEGGMDAWYAYLKENLTYPKQPQRLGIEGTVFLRFVINTDGSIQDVEVVRSVDPQLDQSAIAVIQSSPRWKSAMHHGRPVRSRMTIPIKFKLN